jgi:hypothetical protein
MIDVDNASSASGEGINNRAKHGLICGGIKIAKALPQADERVSLELQLREKPHIMLEECLGGQGALTRFTNCLSITINTDQRVTLDSKLMGMSPGSTTQVNDCTIAGLWQEALQEGHFPYGLLWIERSEEEVEPLGCIGIYHRVLSSS